MNALPHPELPTNPPNTKLSSKLMDSTDDLVESINEFGETAAEAAPELSPFQSCFEDQSQLDPKSKVRLIISCSMAGIVPGLCMQTLLTPPFSIKNTYHISLQKR